MCEVLQLKFSYIKTYKTTYISREKNELLVIALFLNAEFFMILQGFC